MLSARRSRPASAGLNRALDDLQEPATVIEIRDSNVTANSTANTALLLPRIPKPKYRFHGNNSATTSRAAAVRSRAMFHRRVGVGAAFWRGPGDGCCICPRMGPVGASSLLWLTVPPGFRGRSLAAQLRLRGGGTPCRSDFVAYLET